MPDGACFLYDPARDEGFALDQLGALVWDYCDGQSATEVIVAEVSALLPGQPEVVARVEDLLASFADQGLLLPETAASDAITPSRKGAP